MNYGYYPDSYRGRDIYFLNENYQRLLAGGFEYHYFDCSHEIFVYDRKSKEQVRVVTARSNYLPDKLQSIMVDGDPLPASQEQSNHLVVAGRYDRLVYDSQANLFFRFVRHPQDLKTSDGLLRRRNDSEHSIMTLDEQLRVCNEIFLPRRKFVPAFAFSAQGLLWVSFDHPQNELSIEDKLTFVRLRPVL